jgi:hypothetical protein
MDKGDSPNGRGTVTEHFETSRSNRGRQQGDSSTLAGAWPKPSLLTQQACLFEELLNHREQLLMLLQSLRGSLRKTDVDCSEP